MRVLRSSDICRIVGLIEDFYMYDCRNTLAYLEKWMESAGVSRDTIEKVFLILDGGKCAGEEKNLCGLREILEKHYEKPRALAIMQELTDALGVSSPFPCDPVFEALDYEKKAYAIADPVEKIIGRAVRRGDKLVVKYVDVHAFPKKIIVHEMRDRSDIARYEIVFETSSGVVIPLGPLTGQEMVRELRRRALARRSQRLSDVMSAVIRGFITSGRGSVVEA